MSGLVRANNAGQSGIASNILHLLAASAGAVARQGSNTSEATTTSLSSVDLMSASSLSMTAATPFAVWMSARMVASGSNPSGNSPKLTVGKLNSTIVQEAENDSPQTNGWANADGNTQDGVYRTDFGARVANYLSGGISYWARNNQAGGESASHSRIFDTAVAPTATITDVVIRAITVNTTDPDPLVGGDELHVYSFATS